VKIIDFPQGSRRVARRARRQGHGVPHGDVLAKIKTGEAAARRDYRAQIVAEILTGQPQDSGFINDEMQWGIEQEPFAVGLRGAHRKLVDQVGLVLHPSIERSARRLTAWSDSDGLLEIKCPKTATHLQYLMDGAVPRLRAADDVADGVHRAHLVRLRELTTRGCRNLRSSPSACRATTCASRSSSARCSPSWSTWTRCSRPIGIDATL
jgi:hypothetical protein